MTQCFEHRAQMVASEIISHGASPAGRPDEDNGRGQPGPRAAADLAKCEALISHAAETGTVLGQADVDAVRSARSAFDQGGVWSRATGSAFYGAMSRIAASVQYPGQ